MKHMSALCTHRYLLPTALVHRLIEFQWRVTTNRHMYAQWMISPLAMGYE